ncbi:putative Mg2+ transporter-C (MgtC) family protein [Duganella sp. 1411]|uniref:MgtC/SapB family protein n=1 Tax=Duganella sp. 1411 TaxID=2806572 RepID=UPI001AEB8505|nr:MgtC/SapB family protein [Duganella sp. 1411]MBP1207245.1 putative Mg2+ transporter-C (MgtC) family protein [Duganella sp. 1411]
MVDYWDISARLGVALLFGCVIGLERNLHGKPTGMKTLGLVALGAALVAMASMEFAPFDGQYSREALSRAVQGVITGIGFLGAGVIVLDNGSAKIKGLTTAASIWMTACIGIVCGMGAWRVAGIGLILVMLLFLLGHPLERMLHRRWLGKTEKERTEIDMHD